MTKYKLEDLKVGAVFKSKYAISTIIRVGKSQVCYSYQSTLSYAEKFCSIEGLLRGEKGELVVPDIKTNKIKTQKGTLAWAMIQLVKGLKIRDKGWDECEYLHLGPGINKRTQDLDLIDGRGKHAILNGSMESGLMGLKVWELYEEKAGRKTK